MIPLIESDKILFWNADCAKLFADRLASARFSAFFRFPLFATILVFADNKFVRTINNNKFLGDFPEDFPLEFSWFDFTVFYFYIKYLLLFS